MNSEWIGQVKDRPVDQILDLLNKQRGRLGSWGPCPACSETKRSRDDHRMACGVSRDRKGWACHKCGAKGDGVDLIAFEQFGRRSSELDGTNWGAIRTWAERHGLCSPTASGGGERSSLPSVGDLLGGNRRKSTGSSASSLVCDPGSSPDPGGPATPSPQPQPPPPGGAFSWSPDLVEQASNDLWTEDGAGVRAYLMESRKFSEGTIREFGLGARFIRSPDGRVLQQFLVIPLKDERGVAINARFRIIPGPCLDCGGQGGSCRRCKGSGHVLEKPKYRVCSGRPLPLFGSDRLGNDLSGQVIITEGELDVIALYEYGFTVSVVSGTAGAGALHDEWLDQLEPYSNLVIAYDDDDAGNEGAKKFAEKMGADRVSRTRFPHNDAGECLKQGVPEHMIRRCLEQSRPMFGIGIKRVDAYGSVIETLVLNPDTHRGRPSSSKRLTKCLGGHRPGLRIVSGDTGQGKAQPVTEKVLTPNGWVAIGSLQPGDLVYSIDGKPTRVMGVFPQGLRDVVKVELSCGTEILCDHEHLWSVQTDQQASRSSGFHVKTASEISDTVHAGARRRWRLPLPSPVDLPTAKLPLDPYALGVLLGDGALTQSGVVFDNSDAYIMRSVELSLPDGHRMSRTQMGRCTTRCRIAGPTGRPGSNKVLSALQRMGLFGCTSSEKFIPASYLVSSEQQRRAILAGLLDTDGTVEAGVPIFTTTSPQLARGVQSLAHSLGGSTRTSSKIPTFRYKGEKKTGQRAYSVRIWLPDGQSPFRLPRKRDLVQHQIGPVRKIHSVTPVGKAECVCIAVEHPSQLYITKGWALTHNTTFATWAAWDEVKLNKVPVMVTSFEQTPIGTVQKLLRMELGGDFTKVTPEERAEALLELGTLPIHVVDHYGHIPLDKMMQTIRYGVRRLGVKHILIDHLGFLIPEDADSKDERRAIEVIIRALAITAKTLGVLITLICHPRNTPPGERVQMNHIKGASAIKQDADEVLIVVRQPPRPKAKPPIPYPTSRVFVDKCRSEFGIAGSDCTLAFGPLSLHYCDAWDDTPEGNTGALVVTP